MWDMFLCWPSALVGETISSPCPSAFIHYMKQPGSVSRNCTVRGWSAPFPLYNISCAIDDEFWLEKQNQYRTMKVIYTVGYGTSVVTLAVAVVILVYFRRLRCARNYIHIQLFVTFILKAISIFIKDGILFPEKVLDPCMPPTASCKASITFCHYCVMTNFFWLLVEALYLNSLLMASFPHGKKYFWWFVLLGWGSPTVLIIAWILTKLYLENTGCWDHEWQSPYWWIIKGPITASIATNFLLFANIIRILFKKLDPRKINFNNSFQYRRLSKSTLLLIPLFGTHYIVFNFLPEYIHVEGRLYLELCLGSFQPACGRSYSLPKMEKLIETLGHNITNLDENIVAVQDGTMAFKERSEAKNSHVIGLQEQLAMMATEMTTQRTIPPLKKLMKDYDTVTYLAAFLKDMSPCIVGGLNFCLHNLQQKY
ncbi:growth hormone-releasing hormone receptor-like [Protopterus annectens]|uniref:growth hormone-releasing hormone receptor-like n=1 Tax=Protopterus annectens TaxID=7888 RepID=UPI001CF9F32A|nr:growth hormone-releasing hormone receptor-like [Protopterus annectens]